jgi:PPOX class probable F420-dependent enzyme
MAYRLRGKELAFIRSQRLARVATADKHGEPHNVPISPVVITGHIYFASDSTARKVRNLRANPRVALVFDHYTENWRKLAGVMITGSVTIVEHGAAFRRARQALYRKYKLYARIAPLEEGEAVIVCVTPTDSFSWRL